MADSAIGQKYSPGQIMLHRGRRSNGCEEGKWKWKMEMENGLRGGQGCDGGILK